MGDPVPGQRRMAPHRSPLAIVAAYVVVAGAWILASDVTLEVLVGAEALAAASILKGLGFVAVTAAVLYALLRSRERRIGEERRRLEASEAQLRLVTDRSPDLIYRYRLQPTAGWVYLSPAVEMLTGYAPDELVRDLEIGHALIHPDDRAILEEVIDGRRSAVGTLTIRWIRRNGGRSGPRGRSEAGLRSGAGRHRSRGSGSPACTTSSSCGRRS